VVMMANTEDKSSPIRCVGFGLRNNFSFTEPKQQILVDEAHDYL